MNRWNQLLICLACCLPALGAHAERLVYVHEGIGSGALDGAAFTDAEFTVTALVETDDVVSLEPFMTYVQHVEASITIDGLGTFDFLSVTGSLAEHPGQFGAPAAAFGAMGYAGGALEPFGYFWGPLDDVFATWDLIEPLGPLSGDAFHSGWSFSPLITSGGALLIDDTESTHTATFTAHAPPQLALTPESLSASLAQGESQTLSVELANDGDTPLVWQVRDVDTAAGSGPPTVELRGLSGNQAMSPPELSRSAGGGDLPAVSNGTGPRAGEGQIVLSHSESTDIQAGNTQTCSLDDGQTTGDSRFLRVFRLSDFGIIEDLQVDQVTFGVEELTESTDITVALHLLDGALLLDNMTPLATATETLEAQTQSQVTVPIAATVPAGSTLVVEVRSPDQSGAGAFFAGSNDQGESALSYLASDVCGWDEPIPYPELNAPGVNLVMSVTGTAEAVDCQLPEWIATNPAGGMVAPGETETMEVTLAPDTLEPGDHEAAICLDTGDPQRALAPVPVSLTLASGAGSDPVHVPVMNRAAIALLVLLMLAMGIARAGLRG